MTWTKQIGGFVQGPWRAARVAHGKGFRYWLYLRTENHGRVEIGSFENMDEVNAWLLVFGNSELKAWGVEKESICNA